MTTTLFPNDKPLSITELETAIEAARMAETDKLVVFVNSGEAENIIDELKSNGIIDNVFIYESEYVERGKIYAVRPVPNIVEFMKRFALVRKLGSFEHTFPMDCHFVQRKIGTEDRIKATKERIRRSKNYLEQKSLQRELAELERKKRRWIRENIKKP